LCGGFLELRGYYLIGSLKGEQRGRGSLESKNLKIETGFNAQKVFLVKLLRIKEGGRPDSRGEGGEPGQTKMEKSALNLPPKHHSTS